MRRLAIASLALALTACDPFAQGAPSTTPTAAGVSPSPTESVLRGLWVLSPVGLQLRESPSSTATSLTTIPQGTQLTATAEKSGWFQVAYNNQKGWIAAKDSRSVPPQDLVTTRPKLSYANPDGGYYFLYPANWFVTEHGKEVDIIGPVPGGVQGQIPSPLPSGAPFRSGQSSSTIRIRFAADATKLPSLPTIQGALMDTIDFEVGGVTTQRRRYTLGTGGFEADARVKFAADHAVLINFLASAQEELQLFDEVLESIGFSVSPAVTPSPGR